MKHQNTLYTNDNLLVLNGLESESVDLIYLDPPFNTKTMRKGKTKELSFKDIWTLEDIDEHFSYQFKCDEPDLYDYIAMTKKLHSKAMSCYLLFMALRLVELKRVLKQTGSIYLHCDPSISHYLKNMMDYLFGKSHFRNEILWCYTGPGSPGMRQFSRKSDSIFWYSKGKTWTFNIDAARVPYKDPKQSLRKAMSPDGHFTQEDIEMYRKRGKVAENWWTKFSPVGRSPKERTGHATQKPLKLLERIIKVSSKKDDIVLDPFCGCATTCVAAQRLNRKWIGIDDKDYAAEAVAERLMDEQGSLFKDFIRLTNPPARRKDLEWLKPNHPSVRKRLYGEQDGNCANPECQKHLPSANDFHVDHIIPQKKGGGDYFENYQLLCMRCHTKKGNKPMPYIIDHMEDMKKLLERVTYTQKPRKR